MSRRQSIASHRGGTWDNRRLWQGADDVCAAAAGASLSGSTQHWCAGGNPIGNHVFSYPWEDHKVTTCDPQLSASACVFLTCYYTSQSPGSEINLLGVSERGKKLESCCNMFQSAFAISEVWISTCATIRTWGYHRISNMPQNKGSVLRSKRRGDILAPMPGVVPKGRWLCRRHFYLLSFIWSQPPTGKQQRAIQCWQISPEMVSTEVGVEISAFLVPALIPEV